MWHLGLHLLVHQQSSMKLCNLEQLLSWNAHHLVCCSLIDGLSSMRLSEWLLDQISHMFMSASHRTPYCRTTTTLVAISAINALLQPLLDRVQTALDHPAGISDPTWQDAELADLQKLVTAAAEAQAGCALLQPIAKAVAELLAVAAASLHADQSTPTSSETDAAVSASPPCTAINCLLGMAGALVTRTVSVSTAQEAQQRWQQWRQLAASLGLQEQAHLAPVLAAPGKALLLHLQSAAQEPPKKVPLQVRLPVRSVLRCFTACTTVTLCVVQSWRLHPVLLKLDDFIRTACQACGRQHTRAPAVRGQITLLPSYLQVQRDMAFSTACQDLSRRGLLGQLTGPCTLFPCFLHRYSPGPQHQRPAAEAGEGHGPRKDFFEAAAAELMLQRAGGAVLVEVQQHSALPTISQRHSEWHCLCLRAAVAFCACDGQGCHFLLPVTAGHTVQMLVGQLRALRSCSSISAVARTSGTTQAWPEVPILRSSIGWLGGCWARCCTTEQASP